MKPKVTMSAPKGSIKSLPDGGWIQDPQYIDYGDGVGLQLCGGFLFDPNGIPIGHVDSPGPLGHSGVAGVQTPQSFVDCCPCPKCVFKDQPSHCFREPVPKSIGGMSAHCDGFAPKAVTSGK